MDLRSQDNYAGKVVGEMIRVGWVIVMMWGLLPVCGCAPEANDTDKTPFELLDAYVSYLNPEARAGFITKEEVFTNIPHCLCCASENPWQKLFATRFFKKKVEMGVLIL